jgi:hypothetical protein
MGWGEPLAAVVQFYTGVYALVGQRAAGARRFCICMHCMHCTYSLDRQTGGRMEAAQRQ